MSEGAAANCVVGGDQVIIQLSDFTGSQFPHCNGTLESAWPGLSHLGTPVNINARHKIFTREEERGEVPRLVSNISKILFFFFTLYKLC